MKLKLDDAGHVVVQDGMPVYVHDDGRELPFDAKGTIKGINDRGAENKAHREAKEQALAKLQAFDGIDPEAARKALDIVSNLDAKKLIDAGEVEKFKQQTTDAYEKKLKAAEDRFKPVVDELQSTKSKLQSVHLNAAFNGSQFIKDRVAIPPDFMQSKFGAYFSVSDDGEIHAIDRDGTPILSLSKPGTHASVDEALEILVGDHPQRDQILKGTGASGGGAGGARTGAGGKRTVTMSQFSAMSPADQMKTALAADAGDLSITE